MQKLGIVLGVVLTFFALRYAVAENVYFAGPTTVVTADTIAAASSTTYTVAFSALDADRGRPTRAVIFVRATANNTSLDSAKVTIMATQTGIDYHYPDSLSYALVHGGSVGDTATVAIPIWVLSDTAKVIVYNFDGESTLDNVCVSWKSWSEWLTKTAYDQHYTR